MKKISNNECSSKAMITEMELETRCRVAEAKLGLVEELRWVIAPLAGISTHYFSQSTFLSIIVGAIVIFAVPYQFSKDYDKAQDEYERLTGTGKYWLAKEPNKAPEPTPTAGTPRAMERK